MNKITHGIFLVFTLFQMFSTSRVDAQYLNSKSNKMPLSFMSSQFWQNDSTNETVLLSSNFSLGFSRVFHKFGIGLLMGSVGGFGLGYLGAAAYHVISDSKDLSGLGVGIIGASLGFVLFSSLGVTIVSDIYEQDTSYGIVLVGGLAGIVSGTTLGYLVQKSFTNKNELPIFIGAVVGLFAGEIILSEIEFPDWDEYEKDKEIQADVNDLTFHEYVKSTQVINFELLRIQL
ncbi:MAG: hypothetical protein HND52_15690 [Ignavibacteriae bacterium]|nr:hypothetical protein [Ignavibacteriota bacterium]NOG99398.1 hypothetical protein [Ignavibacteriota bacterium]